MSETNFAAFEPKTAGDRTVMHILYGLHTVAWASAGVLAVIAIIVNYIKLADETDALYERHHRYMIATFWWTMLWCVLAAPVAFLLFITIFLIPLAYGLYGVIGLWYLYRCLKGWLRFTNNREPR